MHSFARFRKRAHVAADGARDFATRDFEEETKMERTARGPGHRTVRGQKRAGLRPFLRRRNVASADASSEEPFPRNQTFHAPSPCAAGLVPGPRGTAAAFPLLVALGALRQLEVHLLPRVLGRGERAVGVHVRTAWGRLPTTSFHRFCCGHGQQWAAARAREGPRTIRILTLRLATQGGARATMGWRQKVKLDSSWKRTFYRDL